MPTYRVIRKSDQVEVYRYSADSPIEWAQPPMPFADYDHIEVVETPPEQPPYTGSWRITKLAFRNRFTAQEKVTIEIAALDVPTATLPERALAATLRANQADVAVATYIDLSTGTAAGQRARAGVQALEQYGVLATGRATEILDTPPTDEELFHG